MKQDMGWYDTNTTTHFAASMTEYDIKRSV